MSPARTPPFQPWATLRLLAAFGLVLTLAGLAAARDVSILGSAPVRSAPDTWASVEQVLADGAFVALQDTEGTPGWVLIAAPGARGYVAGRVDGDRLVADEAAVAGTLIAGEAVRVHVATPLRSAPTAGRGVDGELASGTACRVLDQVGTWLLVAGAGGQSGWFDLHQSVVSSMRAADVAAPAPSPTLDIADAPAPTAADAEAARLAEAEETARLEAEREAAQAVAAAEAARREAERAAAAAEKRALEDEAAARKAEKKRAVEDEAAARKAEKKRAAEDEAAARKAEKQRAREEKAAAKRAKKDQGQTDRVVAREEEGSEAPASVAAAEAPAAAETTAEDAREARRAAEARAQAEADAQEAARRAAAEREATAARSAEPAEVAIAPAVAVAIPKKAPAERKTDPRRSPLVGLPLPEPDSGAPAGSRGPAKRSADELLGGYEAPDESSLLASRRARERERRADPVDEARDATLTRVVTEVVARVNDAIITSSEFVQRVGNERERLRRESPELASRVEGDALRTQVLARMVEELLLIDEARVMGVKTERVYEQAKREFMEQAGITDDLELLRLLDATGRTWDDFRRELVRRRLPYLVIQTQVTNRIVVPEDEILAYYREHEADWASADCVRLRELVLLPEARENTRDFNQRLQDILRRVESGEDFCDLAERNSQSPSAAECGLLPQCFGFDDLDQKAARVAFRMRPGDVEPIRTEWGYHVLVLEEHRPREVRSLEEVRPEILRALRQGRYREAVREYIGELREAAFVVIAPSYRRFYDRGLPGGVEGAHGQ